jgi:hypothetical protein
MWIAECSSITENPTRSLQGEEAEAILHLYWTADRAVPAADTSSRKPEKLFDEKQTQKALWR